MVYTERGPRRQQFHVVPAMQQLNSAVTISVDIKTRCGKLQSLIQSRIQPERSGSAHKLRKALYLHYEALTVYFTFVFQEIFTPGLYACRHHRLSRNLYTKL